jgi:Protein of unknown function (DUF1822)
MLNLTPVMFSSLHSSDDATIPMVITQGAQQNAQKFSQQQVNPIKAQQVFRNTLAVSVVNGYLQMLGIETYLDASDSWNPVLRLVNDIADLSLRQGKLECRLVDPGDRYCELPLEVCCDRIGYVIVRLDAEQDATLLGFTHCLSNSNIVSFAQLQPMSALPHYLAQLDTIVDLRQWLEGVYALNWQPPERLLKPKQLALNPLPAGSVQRAQLIELNLCAEHRDVVLLVSVTPQDDLLSVKAQLHPLILAEAYPVGARRTQLTMDCLMPDIRLDLFTDDGTLAKGVVSRSYPRDNCIQIPQFQGHWGECFTIQISIHDYQVRAQFRL